MAPVRKKMHGAGTTGTRRTSGLPCAMGLRLIRDLPGAPGFLATVTRVMPGIMQASSKHHREFDTSVGVSGPHDFAVRRLASRLRFETHLTRQRPSHCRSNVRDDAYAPSSGPERAK